MGLIINAIQDEIRKRNPHTSMSNLRRENHLVVIGNFTFFYNCLHHILFFVCIFVLIPHRFSFLIHLFLLLPNYLSSYRFRILFFKVDKLVICIVISTLKISFQNSFFYY
ncbi:hypothetical protein VIGAN_08041800 [Vigna angularis var. angularis]|uniref:Uncharacterized protein n=1 Tax=Vigna angularis var. angularis TaxID=157739 RepID=A0A0S3SM02_PHAAN|nr:hypothetical protein VIGAN_08041800 [Vigna angularis var. angularis]